MSSTSLYDRLGVSRDASKEEIRRAYKDLAREKHPDRGGDEEEFKKIQEAHEVLADEDRRRMYNMTGSTQENDGGAAAAAAAGMAGGIPFHFMGGAGPFGMPGVAFDMSDMGNVFSQMFGGGGVGGGMRRGAPRAARGPNKHSDIPLTLADFYKGKQIKITFNQARRCGSCKGSGAEKTEPCGTCNGTGARTMMRQIGPGIVAQSRVPCDVCEGDGKRVIRVCVPCGGRKFLERPKQLEISIKPGMKDGEQLTFAGECSESPEFEAPGDVVLTLRRTDAGVSDVDELIWREDNLLIRKEISFAESLLGFKVTIPNHPAGEKKMEWRGGPLLHGAVVRLDGGGMPKKDGGHGDLMIQVLVTPPPCVPWTPDDAARLQAVLGGSALSWELEIDTLKLHNADPQLF